MNITYENIEKFMRTYMRDSHYSARYIADKLDIDPTPDNLTAIDDEALSVVRNGSAHCFDVQGKNGGLFYRFGNFKSV